jgi:hypothetical protein
LHNTAFSLPGLNCVYLCFGSGAAGFNLTMPNKSLIMPLLDEISEEARLAFVFPKILSNGNTNLNPPRPHSRFPRKRL